LPDMDYVLPLTPEIKNILSSVFEMASEDLIRISHDIVCNEDHGHGRMDGYAMMTALAEVVNGLHLAGPHLVANAIFDGTIPAEVRDDFFPGEFVVLPDGAPAFLPG